MDKLSDTLSIEYIEAWADAKKADKAFRKAQLAYRMQYIGDAEFLAAKEIHDKAQAEFDVAYAKEQSNIPNN